MMSFTFPEEGPVRKFLREWKPILPRPKLFSEEMEFQTVWATMTPEQRAIAIRAVAGSAWAQNAAEGIIRQLGLPPAEAAQAKQKWAEHLAERFLQGGIRRAQATIAEATVTAAAPRVRRGRPPRAAGPPPPPEEGGGGGGEGGGGAPPPIGTIPPL